MLVLSWFLFASFFAAVNFNAAADIFVLFCCHIIPVLLIFAASSAVRLAQSRADRSWRLELESSMGSGTLSEIQELGRKTVNS